MDLAKLIVPSKTIWDEFPGCPGFEVQLSYLTRDELMKIRSKAVTNKVNRKSRAVEEELDSDLFQQLYIQAVIKGWKGLKLKYLSKMVPVDLSSMTKNEEGEYIEDVKDETGNDIIAELDFTHKNAELLMKNATGFDTWITDVLDDVENFTKDS